jgi:hypothetical protein
MSTVSTYVFNGKKLISYSDLKIFKDSLLNKGILVQANSINGIFEEIIETNIHHKAELDKFFFEHIFYGQLKNVIFHKINNELPKVKVFIQSIRGIIKTMNRKDSIPVQHHRLFVSRGFYALDVLNIENKGNIFLLGFDYSEMNDRIEIARFLVAQVVLKEGEPVYYLAAVEINYKEKFCLIMFKNLQGIDNIPIGDLLEEEKWTRTISKYLDIVNSHILNPLDISVNFQYKIDRTGMYEMCRVLDDELLKEYREYISNSINSSIEKSIYSWFNVIFKNNHQPSDIQKEDLKEKISSQVLSYYLKNDPQISLVEKARSLGQVGYTTRIEFTANQAGRGATKSKNSKEPIAAEDMFHSLYIDFKGALALGKWSFSWFTEEKNDHIQTTIYISANYFKIIFLPGRHLSKEIIYNVVRYLNRYRNY